MAVDNSKKIDVLVFDGASAPAANAANTTFKTVGSATSISFDVVRENFEITHKASNSNTQRLPGKKDSSGSVTGYIDFNQAVQNFYNPTTDALDQTPAATQNVSALFGYIDAGTTLYLRIGQGNARFIVPVLASGLTQEAGFDDAPTYTFNWEQQGAISFDADVTS